MTHHNSITAARLPTPGGTSAAVPVHPLSGTAATLSRCPDCDGPFSDRIRDEDTGCSLPVDDGEHYCDACDAIWTDEYLAAGWLRAEMAAADLTRSSDVGEVE